MVHSVNVFVHAALGVVALVAGAIPLVARKGSATHKKYGRFFLAVFSGVITTAFIGSLFFRVRPFLIVITLLSFYAAFSGTRVLRTRSRGPGTIDFIVSLLVFAPASWCLIRLRSAHVAWDSTVIYSTLGAVYLVVVYDMMRFVLPNTDFDGLWMYEHAYKIVSAYSALLSAFAGTVLPFYQPLSQLAPSACGLGIIFYQWYRLHVRFGS